MNEASDPEGQRPVPDAHQGKFHVFSDLGAFSAAVLDREARSDFSSVVDLTTNFMEAGEGYLILSFKYFNPQFPSILIFATADDSYVYAPAPLDPIALNVPPHLADRPYGKSTALCYWAATKAVDDYREHLDQLISDLQNLEQLFNHPRYRELLLEFTRVFDRIEDFNEIAVGLEATTVEEMETRYISFDWKVLEAEGNNLIDRCQHRITMLREIAHDYEVQATMNLNHRLERLNDVMRRLTAITVILMIPTLITSHFGMNFRHMPELSQAWAYPAVVAAEILLLVVGAIAFRIIGWL